MSLSQNRGDGWISTFVLVLRLCPRLQNLELVFKLRASCPFEYRRNPLPWLELRSLWLRGIALDFVANHQPALFRILLTDRPLETGSWSSLHNRVKSFFPGSLLGYASYFVHHPPNSRDINAVISELKYCRIHFRSMHQSTLTSSPSFDVEMYLYTQLLTVYLQCHLIPIISENCKNCCYIITITNYVFSFQMR